MSFHFCTHPWDVRDVPEGIQITLKQRDLEPTSVATLVDDLFEIVLENGKRDLWLDFQEIATVPSVAVGKMLALQAKLNQRSGRLIVVNLDPDVHLTLRTTRLCDVIELRLRNAGDTDAGSLF